MSEQAPEPAGGTAPPASSGSSWTWLLPALAFLAGVVITAVVFIVGGSSSSTDAADTAPTALPTVTTSPTTTSSPASVQVPAACVQAAEMTDDVVRAFNDVASAAQALDARRLQETLDAVRQLQPKVQDQSQACLDAAKDTKVVLPSDGPTSASPTP